MFGKNKKPNDETFTEMMDREMPDTENNEEKEEKKMSKGKKIVAGVATGATVVVALVVGFLLGKKTYVDPNSDDEFEDREYTEINPQKSATEDTAD